MTPPEEDAALMLQGASAEEAALHGPAETPGTGAADPGPGETWGIAAEEPDPFAFL